MENDALTAGEDKHMAGEEKQVSLCIRFLRKVRSVFLNNLLLFSTLIGVAFGFLVGFAVRISQPSENALMWLGLPGQLYLRLLKMMIVPLIACSVICGAAALDPKANGKISFIAFVFIISTNALGSALGIGSVYMFNPGKDEIHEQDSVIEGTMQTQDILADLIRNIIPENLFESTFSQTQTMYNVKDKIIEVNTTTGMKNETVKHVSKYLGKMGNPNIIGLIFACTLLGLAAASLKKKGQPFLDFIQSVSDTVIVVVRWFMWTTPIGVISLIAVSIASIDSVEEVFAQLGLFIVAITVGITFQQLILMAGIFFAFTRKNPYSYLISIARPWMIAFAATSTAVAIPEMMAACEDKNKIDKRISRFVIPFSVTISCNGSALYISGATVFIANLTNTSLTIGDVLLIWLLVTVAAMAIPSVPSASIMTTIMILSSMNIPMDDIALLLAVEWYLDRIRSTSSVVSHTFCTAVVYSLCKKDLAEIDRKHVENGDDLDDDDDDKEMEIIVENGKVTNGYLHHNGVNEKESVI
ncbi:excitatory amino acid transporter-like [Ruditapes philippinarum]|uniref:excitatory amino acid transporter-like n=1 Tax=Ruditapes philippinarum TaxID=129788 RepID=UPI00295AB30A|nr:excitatory amino acid transporter-like [Ruditapes philippinarum]